VGVGAEGGDLCQVAAYRFGLDGIRERTRLLDSELQIDGKPGQGTTIRATFPLLQPND
jgi:signal transduction histidine kinase